MKPWHDFQRLKIPALIVLLIWLTCWPAVLLAEPFAQLEPQAGVRIILHDEDCRLRNAVQNLQGRATWEEGGKVFEGCFGLDRERGLVRLYFSDRTVVSVYMQEFQKVSGI